MGRKMTQRMALAVAMAAAVAAPVRANWPGLVFPPPESGFNSGQWEVFVEKDVNGTHSVVPVAVATTCMESDTVNTVISDYLNGNDQLSSLNSGFYDCAMKQSLDIFNQQELCGFDGCPTLAFVQTLEELVDFVRDANTVPDYKVSLHPAAEFLQSSEYEEPGNPFHDGHGYAAFAVTGSNLVVPSPDGERNYPGTLRAEFVSHGILRAFLVVTEPPPYVPDHGYNTTEEDCRIDCSCAVRYLGRKWTEVNARRRLSRALRTKSGASSQHSRRLQEECVQLGDNPDYYPANMTCCEPYVPCYKDWYGKMEYFTRCASSQDLCDNNKWKEDYDETPDPLQDSPEIDFAMCDVNSECQNTPNCTDYLDGFLEHGMDPTEDKFAEFFTMDPPLPLDHPLFNVLHCTVDGMRLKEIEELTQEGIEVDPNVCVAEVSDCFANDACVKVLILNMFLSESMVEGYTDMISSDPSAVLLGQELFSSLGSCFDHLRPTKWWEEGGVLTIPLEDVPCACGGHPNSIFERELNFNLGMSMSEVERLSMFDMCHASEQVVATVQVQKANSDDYMYPQPSHTAMEWSSMKVEAPFDSAFIQDCLGLGDCSSDAQWILDDLDRNFDTWEAIKPPLGHCGYMSQRSGMHWHRGWYMSCNALLVRTPFADMRPAIRGYIPQAYLRFHNSTEFHMPIWGSLQPAEYVFQLGHGSQAFANVDVQLQQYNGYQVFTALDGPVEAPIGATWENCAETCSCHLLALEEAYNNANAADFVNGSLLVPEMSIPCACTQNDYPIQEAWRTEQYDYQYYPHPEVRTHLRFCSAGRKVLFTDPNINPDNVSGGGGGGGGEERKWSWVCDCDLNTRTREDCQSECEMVRKQWAWTCSAGPEAGFREIEFNSNEFAELAGQCMK